MGTDTPKPALLWARKLIERTWTVLHGGQPYQLQDVDRTPVARAHAKHLARSYAVPPDVRARARA